MNHTLLTIETLKPLIILVLPLVYISILLIIDQIRVRGISKEILDQWRADPANWGNGIIYKNPADPRIFPPKRLQAFGWTINVANRMSIAALIGLLALILSCIILL